MDPLQANQNPANIPQQPGTNPTSLEDFIRQNPNVPAQQQVTNQQLFGGGAPIVNANAEQPKVIERIIYKKQRVHGFFRTLTIIALLIIGFLMLFEKMGIFSLNIQGFDLSLAYPIFVILSSIIIWSYRGILGKIFGLLMFLVVVGGFFTIEVFSLLNPSLKTKNGSYVAYPSASSMNYTKLYINTFVTDLALQGKQTTNIVEGNYGSDRDFLVKSGIVVSGSYQYLVLSEDTNINLLQNLYTKLALGITNDQPIYLYLKNFLALQKINLVPVNRHSFVDYNGLTLLDLTLGIPQKNTASVDIQAVGGDITLHIPSSVGVKLYHHDYIGKLTLTNFEQKGPDYFESTNLSTAKKVITITIKLGVGRTMLVRDK